MIMKHLLFSTLIFALSVLSLGAQQYQGQFAVTLMDAGAVPSAVVQAQDSNFPGITVRQWKKQEYQGKRSSSTQYLAVFTQNGQNTRVRYTDTGRGISTYTTYGPEALPTPITETISTTYADYSLTGAAEIASLQQAWSGFRIRLRKGGQKLVVWLNADGELINPQGVPQEVSAEEAE